MKVLVFEAKKKCKDGRPYIYGIPFNQIRELKTIHGGQNVQCRINGIETHCSFDNIVEALGERVKVK